MVDQLRHTVVIYSSRDGHSRDTPTVLVPQLTECNLPKQRANCGSPSGMQIEAGDLAFASQAWLAGLQPGFIVKAGIEPAHGGSIDLGIDLSGHQRQPAMGCSKPRSCLNIVLEYRRAA